jgi:uncharacterized membrane protein
MDDAGFTTYVQQKLQLYSPSPISSTGTLSLSVSAPGSATNLPSLKPVHDSCVATPAKCDRAVNDYVQGVAHDVLQRATSSPAAQPATPANATQLVACNHTTHTVQLASVYIPLSSTRWRSTGWMPLEPDKCRGILLTSNSTFYARAEAAVRSTMHDPYLKGGMTEGDVTIANAGGDIDLCVPHLGDWDDTADSLNTLCKTDKEPAKFRTFHADGQAMQIWNLMQ